MAEDPVPTQVVELVHVFVYENVKGIPDPQTNTGRGLNARQYVVRRRLLFDAFKQGGLDRNADEARTYRTLVNECRDWGAFGRQQSVVQTCLHCHMYWKEKVGIFSLNSTSCYLAHQTQGVVIPMGSGPIRTYSRATHGRVEIPPRELPAAGRIRARRAGRRRPREETMTTGHAGCGSAIRCPSRICFAPPPRLAVC